MTEKLRHWILIFICSGILWLSLGCQQQANSEVNNAKIRHILDRLSFGATPETIQQVQSKGIEAYIQTQLVPESITESSKLNKYLAKFDLIQMNPGELWQKFARNQIKLRQPEISTADIAKLRKQNHNHKIKVRRQTVEANLLRAIHSNRQLQEIMVGFWFNHFNVFADKKVVSFWLADYENDLRTHALGNFRDLLEVTAHHPAMLIYLDNELNTAPNSPGVRGRYKGLNENYARELMELHTLGVDGGYTQDDVETLARILTGWGVDRTNKKGDENGFFFYANRHDRSDKVFLGHKILGGGVEEGEKALDILAEHPATANFISYKLAQYFVADQPPSSLVDSLAQQFLDSKGDIKVVMDTLIHSPEFNDPQYYGQKFKTPYQYLVSLIRISGIKQPNLKRVDGMLQQLAMPPYRCQTPDGYKNTEDAWLNPDAMLRRVSFATAIANGALDRESSVDVARIRQSLGNDFSAQTQAVIDNNPSRLRTALMLGSPEAMYR